MRQAFSEAISMVTILRNIFISSIKWGKKSQQKKTKHIAVIISAV